VLEIGFGDGALATNLIKHKGCRVMGLEIDPRKVEAAQAMGLCVLYGDIENEACTHALDRDWDAVIFVDVLEHLRDPWSVLQRCHKLLNDNGAVIACVPNVAHYSMRLRLLLGRFDYNPSGGIRDQTHLRFFTTASLRNLVIRTGFAIDYVYYRSNLTGQPWRYPRIESAIGARLARIWPNLFAYQTIFRARPTKKRVCHEFDAVLAV
jgi:SAM-dependent methyltransferase